MVVIDFYSKKKVRRFFELKRRFLNQRRFSTSKKRPTKRSLTEKKKTLKEFSKTARVRSPNRSGFLFQTKGYKP